MDPYPLPPQVPYEPPGTGRGRKVAGIVIALLVAAAFTAVAVLLLAGVIRFGSAVVNETVTSRSVDPAGRPASKTTTFPPTSERIYCCVQGRFFEDTRLEAAWYFGSKRIAKSGGTCGSLGGASGGRFAATSMWLDFFIERPEGGWSAGRYEVRVLLNGNRVSTERFTVGKEESEPEDEPGNKTYRDPQGAFSFRYPSQWVKADPASLDGASVGFASPAGGEPPPSVAVVKTELESASLDYLNGLLEKEGVPKEERFATYSLGDKKGARREFAWEMDLSGRKVPMKTIQVVVKGKDGVYEMNAHSAAADFEKNSSVLDAIVNSFRVS